MAVEIKKPTYFNFQNTDVDFSEIMYSNASEADIDAFVNRTNQKAVDSFIPNNIDAEIDKLVQPDNPENPMSWIFNRYDDEQLIGWSEKGKIGFAETWERMNKWEILPFLNGVAVADDIKILNLLRKSEREPDKITIEEQAKLKEFIDDMAEIDIRGYSFAGKSLQGVTTSLAFMGEFLVSGGLLSAGKKAAQETGEAVIKKTVASKAKKMIGESIARTALSPHRVVGSYYDRKIAGGLAFNDEGMKIYKEMSEAPTITMLKSIGDVWVSQASELAGEYFLSDAYKMLGGKIRSKLPKGFNTAFSNFVRSETSESLAQGMAKFGWNGLLEELGEERLESFMSMALGLTNKEYNMENIVKSFGYENLEELGLEFTTIALSGGVARGGAMLINKLSQQLEKNGVKLTKEEEAELVNSVLVMSSEQRRTVMDRIKAIETEADTEAYNQNIGSFKQMVDISVPSEQVDANMQLIEAMTAVASVKTGIKRSELVMQMPIVQRGGDIGGLSQEAQQAFYSKLQQTVETKMPNSMLAKDFENWLGNQQLKGEEIEYSGLKEFLQGKEKVTKAEVAGFIAGSQIQIEEVNKGGVGTNLTYEQLTPELKDIVDRFDKEEFDIYEFNSRLKKLGYEATFNPDNTLDNLSKIDSSPTKFSQWQLPGGENYREILFTLPDVAKKAEKSSMEYKQKLIDKYGENWRSLKTEEESKEFNRLLDDGIKQEDDKIEGKNVYKSSHWSESNVLAHTRLNDRTDADGNKVLFVEEIQSDWHQEGRKKGYRNKVYSITYKTDTGIETSEFKTRKEAEAFLPTVQSSSAGIREIDNGVVPNAPFKKTWHEFVFKKILDMAVKQGYDKVAWTTGEQQAERYDLSKQIDAVTYKKKSNGNYTIQALKDGDIVSDSSMLDVPENQLEDIIGKDVAKKIIAGEGAQYKDYKDVKSLSGIDLKVGGEGMKGFYDDILPKTVDKYVKKWGAKTGYLVLDTPLQEDMSDWGIQRIEGGGYQVINTYSEVAGNYKTEEEAWSKVAELNRPKIVANVHAIDITDAMKNEIIEKGQPLFQSKQLEESLYILNKLAKSYGKKNTNINRELDFEKQKELYKLKEDVINKHGVDTGVVHRLSNYFAKLYTIGSKSFHKKVSVSEIIKDKFSDELAKQGITINNSLPWQSNFEYSFESENKDLLKTKTVNNKDVYINKEIQALDENIKKYLNSIEKLDSVPQNIIDDKKDITKEQEIKLIRLLKESLVELQQSKQGAYNPKLNLISLLENADQSTFMHEMSHWFLELYMNNAPKELAPIYKFANIEQGKELSEPEYKKLHETFARGFESYLMTGKAPNKGLAKVFAQFKDWLLGIYTNVAGLSRAGGINVKLNQEIIDFYDSLLNTEQEIEVDTSITAESLGDRDIDLYQENKKKLEELKKKKQELSKKYGKKATASMASVNAAIAELELYFGKKTGTIKIEAETAYNDLPISAVIEGKIRLTPEVKGMMDRYNVPANVRTTNQTAKTLDEWATDLNTTEEQILEEVSRIKSKKSFIDSYFEETKQGIDAEGTAIETDKLLSDIANKLKEDAQAGKVTELQKDVIKYIRDMNIANADKVKFLGKIQQAKTAYSQRKVLNELYDLERKYYEKQQRNLLDTKIQKMLKQTAEKPKDGVRKGKYEYEDNMLFRELRDINKLTQEQAEKKLEEYSGYQEEEMLTEQELLTRIFTAYKAYGKSKGELELFDELYNKLNNAINSAKQSRDEADFKDKLERKEKQKEFIDAINKMKFKGDAKSFLTKVVNVYRTGSFGAGANMWSLINSIAGKEMADKYNMEMAELKRDTNIYMQVKDTLQQALDILGFSNATEFYEMIDKYSAEEHVLMELNPEFEGEFIPRKFNRMGIIDIYNAIKNDKTKADYYRAYGEENVTALVNQLSEREIEFADMLMDKAQEKSEEVNQRHIALTGLSLKKVDNYWPATSVKPQAKLNDNMAGEIILASFQKERVAGAVTPIPFDAWRKLSNHIAGVEEVVEVVSAWREARKILDNQTLMSKINEKYGESVYKTLIKQVNALSIEGLRQDAQPIDNMISVVFGNWVKAKIGLNPAVFVKQLISTGNYIENMPAADWAKYFAEGVANPKETLDFMFKASPYLEARFSKGYNEDIQKALAEGKKMATNKKITNITTSLVRAGDIGAIVYGGYPYVKYLTDVKGMSLEQAIKEFEQVTVRSQQSGLKSSVDLLQQSKNPFVNFFFAFKNTPKQYMRIISDAMISYYNGDINEQQLIKTLTIYALVQPALFGIATQAMRSLLSGDDDDYLDDIASNIFTSYTTAFPVINDVNQLAVNTLIAEVTGGKKPYKMGSQPLLSDLEMLTRKLLKGFDDTDFFDFIDIISVPVELSTGFPVQTIVRPIESRIK